jgi:hypothetical protein
VKRVVEEKYEFMSRPWLIKLETIIRELTEAAGDPLAGVTYSMNQVYTDPPHHLAQDSEGRMCGWWVRLHDGQIEFGTGEIPSANLKLIAPYAVMLPLARLVRAEDPKALERTVAAIREGVAAGTMVFEWDGLPQPAPLEATHDRIAKHTA